MMNTKTLFSYFTFMIFSITVFAQNSDSIAMKKYVISKVRHADETVITNKKCEIITKKKLLENKSIKDILKSFKGNEFTIVSYRLTILAKGKDLIEFESTGNQFSKEVIEEIKKLHFSDMLFFEYIRVSQKNNNKIKLLSPECFIISE